MYIKKSLILSLFLCLMVSSIYASNIGRDIYGIYTETYNGVAKDYDADASSSGSDFMNFWPEKGAGNTEETKIEGKMSVKIVGGSWLTCQFRTAQSFSGYERIYFSAKFPNGGDRSKAFIKLKDSSERSLQFDSSAIQRVDGGSGTGIVADGSWHTYYIPLSAFSGLTISSLSCPLILSSSSNGPTFYIDNVYFTKSSFGVGTLSVTLKKISSNTTDSDGNITWSASSFRQGWIAAEQYVELDWQQQVPSNNWYIQVYTNNSGNQTGLIGVNKNGVQKGTIGLACRVKNRVLPSDGDTLDIVACEYGLYDAGKYSSNPWTYPWLAVKDESEITVNRKDTSDSSMVWDPVNGYLDTMWNGNLVREACGYDKTTRLYFAANCGDALGGLKYQGNIVVALNYE